MMDLILRASTKAALATWLKTAPHDFLDADNIPVEGFQYAEWGGNGKIMTAGPVTDADGNVTTPAAFLPGFVILARLSGGLLTRDALIADGADPNKLEQWARSKVARYIKNNGTPGKIGGITYYELDGVRIFRPADVFDWLAAHDLPGHEWAGGNQT